MLRPFLLIGVGGSGGKTLRVIRDDLSRRLQQAGWTGDIPRAWQFLHIDVPTIADGNDPDLPGQLPARDYQGMVASGVDYRTIDTALTRAGGQHVIDALGGWRPDPNRVAIPAARGAGQFRALGRVITVASLDRVRDALQGARRQLTGAEVIGELQAVTRALGSTPTSISHEPTVIVVSSIAGGTGSGAFIDVCDAVRALGDTWANEIIGMLYAPDVFDYLPEAARRGVRPNSLAAVAELLSGFWNDAGPSEGTVDLFSKYGVQIGSSGKLGPRYPFLIGARNESVTYQTQNDIYQAIGRSVAAWVASPLLQDRMSAYTQAQWAATAQSVPDNLPLHSQGTETPFVALGSARVGLGRDRFRDYASEHLARTVMDRVVRRHEELRPYGDDRTEKQLVQDTANTVFGGFLATSGLHERGEDHDQIIDALRPQSLASDLKLVYRETLSKVRETIPEKGARASDVRNTIRNTVTDRRSSFQTAQLKNRTDAARRWVQSIQLDLSALVARSIAQHGAPVTVELLRRLSMEIMQVRDELLTEAASNRRWAADIDVMVRGALDDPDTAVVLQTTDRLENAVRRALETFAREQEAEIRELAAELIPDLNANVLNPLIEAVTYGLESLASAASGSREDGINTAAWPIGDSIPERLRSAPNEFLLESTENYPEILGDLIKRTVGAKEAGETRREAEMQVLLGTDEIAAAVQYLVKRETTWTPQNHLLHETVTAAPSRASFRLAAGPGDLLARSREWLHREGTAAGRYMNEGLRDYLDPDVVGPAELESRLNRFEGQLTAALNAGAPLVKVNSSVLVQVHERHEVAYTVNFSEIPLPEKSAARELFRKVLTARGQWREEVGKAFTDDNGASIDIFTVMSEPYEPVVFDSLMGPIASEWGARSNTPDQHAEFWRWRRARPLIEALPLSPGILHSMVRGWFVAGLLNQVEIHADGAAVYAPSAVGKGGDMARFPWPTLTPVRTNGPDLLPALLESVSLAMLNVNTSESLVPMRPYERLLELGGGGSDELAPELEAWILSGTNAYGPKSDVDWEVRKVAAEQKLEGLIHNFTSYFEQFDKQTELLNFPGSYELRREILSNLGELLRRIKALQPLSAAGIFV